MAVFLQERKQTAIFLGIEGPTMSAFTDAFAGLVRVAGTGRSYLRSEVMTPGGLDTDETMARPFGTGLDFERTVAVPDQGTDGPVEAKLSLRVIHATGTGASDNTEPTPFDGLFVRMRLDWTTSGGDEHVSAASYLMSADKLAQMDTAPDLDAKYAGVQIDEGTDPDAMAEIFGRSMGDTISASSLFGAMWNQGFPGDITDYLSESEEDVATLRARFETNTGYQEMIIKLVQEAEPDLACMLIDNEMGVPLPEEIVKVWQWVKRQPDLATA